MKLDAIDVRILEAVQLDGRITKVALSEKVGLSATPCWVRLRKLEKAGIIASYHARVAIHRIAPIASILMEVTLENHRQADFERFERVISTIPEVVTCWSVGGGVDYIMRIVTTDIDAYQRLVDTLRARNLGIARYFTYIVTKTVKDESAMPLSILPRPSDATAN